MRVALLAGPRPASAPRACRRKGLGRGALAGALLLSAAGVAATWPAWADIVRIAARDDEQSHVFLVPVVFAWLLWVRRERLRDHAPRAQWAGPLLVALGAVSSYLGDRHLVEAAWHLGAIAVVVGCFLSVAGGSFLLRFLPAFAALLFLVPVPGVVRQAIALPLQSASAAVTQSALDAFGVPVERSGNALHVNGRDVAIAEACNGLRMVFALVMVTYAFAYGVSLRDGVRVLVLALSPVVALAFNVVRLVPTVWAYGYLDESTATTLHDVTGWLMPPCAFLTLLGLMRLLRWAQVPVTHYVLAHAS